MIDRIRAALARMFTVRDTRNSRESDIPHDPHVASTRATIPDRGSYVGRAGADDTDTGSSGAEARANRSKPQRP